MQGHLRSQVREGERPPDPLLPLLQVSCLSLQNIQPHPGSTRGRDHPEMGKGTSHPHSPGGCWGRWGAAIARAVLAGEPGTATSAAPNPCQRHRVSDSSPRG